VAAVAFLFASYPCRIWAQTEPQPPPTLAAAKIAFSMLPDAPVPQTSGVEVAQSGQSPASPAQPSSSSSQPAAAKPGADPAATPDPASAAVAKPTQREQAEQDLKKEEKQRLLGVMPQFQVVMNGQAVPLTGGQKWRLALHSAIDPFYIGWAFVIGGGYGELVGNNNGYGWGADGYIKRVGANYADNVNGALIGNALLPELLHQDPRYFRLGHGKIIHRFLYAAASTVVCHGDNGKNQPNVSNVLGNYISGAISNSYYPANERGMKLTLENGTSVSLFGALGGQILEFGPDLARLVHHKRHQAVPAAAPSAPATVPPAALGASPAAPAGSH
jgi:hypothetical protein